MQVALSSVNWGTEAEPEPGKNATARSTRCASSRPSPGGRPGAVVAALTASLPEAPGGDRQFDYRYCWVRDSSLAVSVAALLGRGDLARGYLEFVLARAASTLAQEAIDAAETGYTAPLWAARRPAPALRRAAWPRALRGQAARVGALPGGLLDALLQQLS
jgi:hypothetical protein